MRVDSRHAIKPRVSLSDIGLDGAEGSVQLDNGDAVLRVESGSVVVNSASRAGPYVSTSIGRSDPPIMLCDGDTVSGTTKVATFQQMPADSPRKRAHESSDDSGDETDVDEAPAPAPVAAPSTASSSSSLPRPRGGAIAAVAAAPAPPPDVSLMAEPRPLPPHLPPLRMSANFDWSKHARVKTDNTSQIALAEDLKAADHKLRNFHEWVMMEKFDGMRWVWSGSGFSTKAGNQQAPPPESIRAMLPSIPLDGELWAGRLRFDHVGGHTGAPAEHREEYWASLKYVVYDTKDQPERPLTERLSAIRAQLKARPAHDSSRIDVVEALPCRCSGACLAGLEKRNNEFVKPCPGFSAENPGCPAEFLTRVVKAGGEGIILRRNTSWKAGKEHREVLKVKLRYDHEAVVVGAKMEKESLRIRSINQPTVVGKCDCRCSITCVRNKELCRCEPADYHIIDVPWSKMCTVCEASASDCHCPKGTEKLDPWDEKACRARGWVDSQGKPGFFHPPPGAVVTYRYQRGISTGHPRFPKFARVHPAGCDCEPCVWAATDGNGARAAEAAAQAHK